MWVPNLPTVSTGKCYTNAVGLRLFHKQHAAAFSKADCLSPQNQLLWLLLELQLHCPLRPASALRCTDGNKELRLVANIQRDYNYITRALRAVGIEQRRDFRGSYRDCSRPV